MEFKLHSNGATKMTPTELDRITRDCCKELKNININLENIAYSLEKLTKENQNKDTADDLILMLKELNRSQLQSINEGDSEDENENDYEYEKTDEDDY